jgi:membrane protein DedA with SNARE-associated domain
LSLGAVLPYLHEYGYAAVGAGLLLESMGLPLLIAAAVLAARGVFDIALLLALAWAAATVGNIIGFVIGRQAGHQLVVRHGARVGITGARLARVQAGFERYGAWLLIAARFIVVLRSLSGIVAGTLAMTWPRFLVFNAVGAALWVGWWGLMSYWLGGKMFRLIHGLGHIEPVLFVLAAIAVTVLIARLRRRRR